MTERRIPSLQIPCSQARDMNGGWHVFVFWQGAICGFGAGGDPTAAMQSAHADVSINMQLPIDAFILVNSCSYQYPPKATIRH